MLRELRLSSDKFEISEYREEMRKLHKAALKAQAALKKLGIDEVEEIDAIQFI